MLHSGFSEICNVIPVISERPADMGQLELPWFTRRLARLIIEVLESSTTRIGNSGKTDLLIVFIPSLGPGCEKSRSRTVNIGMVSVDK